jgi:hypothetical protein
MPRSWSFEATVDAPPDAVFAWMTDYREDDHANADFRRGAGVPADDRAHSHRVVERKDARHLVVRDEWGKERFELHVELAPEAREVRLAGAFGYRAVWRAEPLGAGTRVSVRGELAPTGVARLFAGLFASRMEKQMRDDFHGHLADLRASLVV